VLVVNTPGGNTVSTAELAFSHILAAARKIPQAVASLKAGRWDRKKYTGTELSGKVLGVVGVGRIGTEVARRCKAMGMVVVGYDPIMTESACRASGIEPVPLEELFRRSDFITLHTPITPETRHLINRDTLAQCKDGVRIVNCARGGIVDEEALLEALESGKVAGAGLDVLESEPPEAGYALVAHPNVVVTPHLGASTKDAQVRVARAVAEQMCDILDGGTMVGVVNAPDVSYARAKSLEPYVMLAERMGAIQAQLLGPAQVRRVGVTLRGKDLARPELVDTVKTAVLRGTLQAITATDVNFVNARAVAAEKGLSVSVNTSESTELESGYSNSMSVTFELHGLLNANRVITGTVHGGGELRITSMDGFELDLPPAPHMVFFNNEDRPGVLREVAAVLSESGLNIAHFSSGRRADAHAAMGAVVTDEPVPAEVVDRLAAVSGLSNAAAVTLREDVDPMLNVRSSSETVNRQGVLFGSSKPSARPRSPEFSSGPCKKRPGYDLAALPTACLGRSHRSKLGKARLKRAIEDTRRILRVPDDYLIGIVPASDTGAYEMAMWSMLGERPVDAFYWESFGKGWFGDAKSHLKLESTGLREFSADYGHLPDMSQASPDHDVLFTWNGTTSGVRVPDASFISPDRTGLAFNDATSAAFAMDIEWDKVDVTTYSWQKVLGGEGAHGVLILSPRAVERLETFTPDRALPKIFRMVKKGKVDRSIFEGSTINTPSMLCVEDYIDALDWAEREGGLKGLMKRSQDNLEVVRGFVERNDWINFLAQDPATLSSTSICLTLDLNAAQIKKFVGLLESEGVAYDIGAYRDAPPGLRIWGGATVEKEDLQALMPWLSWAYDVCAEDSRVEKAA